MSVFKDLYVKRNLNVDGNLTILGTTTTNTTTVINNNVNFADKHLYLNKDLTTNTGQSGGLIINYNALTDVITPTSGMFTSTTTLAATSALNNGDIIQITSAGLSNNNGIFVLAGTAGVHSTTILTIRDDYPFAQTRFTVDATDTTAVVKKVNISIIQNNATTGEWENLVGSNVFSPNFATPRKLLLTGDGFTGTTLNLTGDTNQIVLNSDGDGAALTISSGTQSAGPKTFTLPNVAADTFVMVNAAQTLALKTLLTPSITSIVNSGFTLTIPSAASDTFVMAAATQAVTNKAFTSCTMPHTNITGLGANMAAFLAGPTSATLSATVGDETGSGLLVFGTSPTLVTPTIASIRSGAFIFSIPTLTLNHDTFVGVYLAQTLTNKIIKESVQSLSANATLTSTSAPIIAYTIAATNLTLTLPSVSGNAGLTYKIVIVSTPGTNTLQISPTTGERINGIVNDTILLNIAFQTVTLTCVGNSWYIM